MMDFFISSAHAQTAAASPNAGLFNLLFIGGMFVLFYLILWRPQSKRAKEHRELVSALGKGDEVLTSGGILGKVTKVSGEYITVEVANGVELNLQKSSVAAALPKGTIKSIDN
ncbi:preprotein translocase subunit YajC [Gammaproteobacteria bacterium LSUCC0112]|jgi:preprotein translocase subunit YajC|nr:preprotein translocase subunit YajC [Gammaproteobacteria bacterium LSUCC0112]